MRERIAIAISILAVVLLAGLSVLFAAYQNPVAPGEPVAALAPDSDAGHPDHPVMGRAVFRNWGCLRCHSVEGIGSRRYPLDGVGSRRTTGELFAWTVGGRDVQDSLSPSALRAKQRYQQIPEEELRALLAWMQGLRD
jgi:hypothetical protein